ncbi:MAG: LITAF-like zinc ribbon domain-containing protein [Clostridia bacterium]|nr:LITAF-like zinc ribbon domain-containing protein [Clostridia bacterium]
METYNCPHCGSMNEPVNKARWETKDKVIAAILFLLFFPLGIIYVLVKQISGKQKFCPDCQMFYSEAQQTSTSDDIAKIKNVVKTVAKDPNVRKSVKDLKNSAKELQDTFYIN